MAASSRARPPPRGEIAVTLSRRRPHRRGRGRAARAARRGPRRPARRPRQRLRARGRHPARPGRRLRGARPRRRARRVDIGEADGRTFLGIASLGLRLRRQPDRQRRARRSSAGSSTSTARCAPSSRGSPPLRRRDRRRAHGASRVERRRGELGLRRRDAPRPDARLDDGALDVVLIGDARGCASLVTLPQVFHGAHVHRPDGPRAARRRAAGRRRPPVHRLRRRRPDRRPAHHDARGPRRAEGSAARHDRPLEWKVAAARAAGAVVAARRARRHEPARQGPACASSRTRSGGSRPGWRTAAR